MIILFTVILLQPSTIQCFWPPPYEAKFEDNENFVISMEATEDEEEMIKKKDIIALHLGIDNRKMEPLHRQFKKRKRRDETLIQPYIEKSHGLSSKIWKRMLDENFQKHIGELPVKDTNETLDDTELYDEVSEQAVLLSSSLKPPEQYDYDSLKIEYYNEVSHQSKSNFNFTAKAKMQEPLKDAVNEIVDFKRPKNCSKEEGRNFGIKSVECLWDDYKKSHTKNDKIKILKKAMKIMVIWLMIYIVIAVPCWCKYGICCCCCRCSFCRPLSVINNAKKFVATNPPAIFIENEKKKEYEPTIYEIEAYNKLLKSIRKL